MLEQRTERKLCPWVFANYHEQEVPTGFQDASCFGDSLITPGSIDVIHGIGAYDPIELGRRNWQFPHVRLHNRRTLIDSRRS
jgi:hypothetical protein